MSGAERTWKEAEDWFAKASQDMRTARLCLADAGGDLVGVAAYHSQQGAEKMVKGLLAAAGAPLRRTHDLDELVTEVTPHFPTLVAVLDHFRPQIRELSAASGGGAGR